MSDEPAALRSQRNIAIQFREMLSQHVRSLNALHTGTLWGIIPAPRSTSRVGRATARAHDDAGNHPAINGLCTQRMQHLYTKHWQGFLAPFSSSAGTGVSPRASTF